LYKEALDFYSKALEVCGETTRAMLSNWALCALEMRNFGDALASTAASLRVGYNDKAIFRLVKVLSLLGDCDLARQAFDEILLRPPANLKQFTGLKSQLQRCEDYRKAMVAGAADSLDEATVLVHDTPSCIGNWIHGCVETFSTRNKGRGLRATRDLAAGSVVLVEWALVSEAFDSNKNFIASNTVDTTFQLGSAAQLRTIVVNRLRREAVLAQILSHMSDADNTPSLVPVSDLLVNLELFPFLLPTHYEYSANTATEITADRIDKILNINCHGTTPFAPDSRDCESELYPTVSMMNHASIPNCAFAPSSLKFLCIVLTLNPIQAGEELTMKY
jgi:hypothetical protein